MNLETAMEGIGKGLKEPLLGMHHLLFCCIAGLVVFALRRRPHEMLYYVVPLIPAYILERIQSFPSGLLQVLVALTVVGILFQQWLYEKLASYAVPLLLMAGFFHGLGLAKAVAGSSLSVFVAYIVSATLVQGIIIYGFGTLSQSLSLKSPDGFEGLENILSAVGVGVALAYFFLAF